MKLRNVALAVTTLAVAPITNAALVNVNFEKFTPGGPGTPATESQLEGPGGGLGTSWNQYAANSSSGTVVDSTGANTTVTVTTNFSEGRFGNTTTDLDVFHSTLTDFGRGQNRTVTVGGLSPSALYDVWVIAYRDSGTAVERLGGYWTSVNTTTSTSTQLLSSVDTRNGTSFQDGVNYLLFENVEADGGGNIVFTGKGGEATDPDFTADVRLGLSGLQINQVPEPSAVALFGIGGLLVLRRRR